MSKTVSKLALAASIVLAMAFTFSCSESGQSDFYGVWISKYYSTFWEINKNAITEFEVSESYQDGFKKNKYSIVKWEKQSDKYFIVYTLDENNGKIDFEVSIDAYSDLQISFLLSRKEGRETYETKKSSTAELNKAIKEAAAAQQAAQKEKEEKEKKEKEEREKEAARIAALQSSFTDQRDGKTYKTVKIGTQTWMAENLNYDASGSISYKNDESNCKEYGRLYNWNTAMKACPSGWHLPSKNEYEALDNTVGGKKVAGKKLKSLSGWSWNEGKSGGGTDEFGFSALPGSYRNEFGVFGYVGSGGYWWSSSEYSSFDAYYRNMGYQNDGTSWHNSDKQRSLYSVRCLQD